MIIILTRIRVGVFLFEKKFNLKFLYKGNCKYKSKIAKLKTFSHLPQSLPIKNNKNIGVIDKKING